MLKSLGSKLFLQILLVGLVAFLLCLPCLFRGMPSTSNTPTHLKYQHHFSKQFWSGEIYPRWLAEENFGYGSPVFLVQYPLPYYVTALLRPLNAFPLANRESRELGIFCFLALVAAGLAMRLWLKTFTSPLAATLSALVYISLPFILADGIYARGAIGELCTFIWMPLAFYFCESLAVRRSAIFALAGVFALLLVSNLLASILFTPVLIIYAFWSNRGASKSFFALSLPVVAAEALGGGIAAIYLLPFVVNRQLRQLFNLPQMESVLPGYKLGLYFLNLNSTNLSNRTILVSVAVTLVFAGVLGRNILRAGVPAPRKWIMAALLVLSLLSLIPNLGLRFVRASGFDFQIGSAGDFAADVFLTSFFTVVLGMLAFCRTAGGPAESHRESLLFFIAAGSYFLMLPFSAPLWKVLPGISVVQFPFRLGGVLCVAVVGLLAPAFDSCLASSAIPRGGPSRLMLSMATLGVVAGGFLTWRIDNCFRHPKKTQFDAAQDIDPMYRAYVPLPQLFAFAKTLGTAPETYSIQNPIPANAQQPRLLDGDCDLRIKRENPRQWLVSADCKTLARARLDLLYSPLWKIMPADATSASSTLSTSPEALTELTLPPGKHNFRLYFDLGPAARAGALVSGVSLLLAVIGFAYFSLRPSSISQS